MVGTRDTSNIDLESPDRKIWIRLILQSSSPKGSFCSFIQTDFQPANKTVKVSTGFL